MAVITSFSEYQNSIGTSFRLLEAPTPIDFVLTSATVVADTPRQLVYSLLFTAPPPAHPQQTYAFSHERLGNLELFLVPIRQSADAVTYEATFNLLK